jgi:putative oxidoreductase
VDLAYAGAIVVEVGFALALLLGWRTRLVALVMALFALVTGLACHATHLDDQNQVIHFLKNISIAGGLLQVVAYGAGRFSLDGWKARLAQR